MDKIERMWGVTLWEKVFVKNCVRFAMLYGSEIWCLRENEKGNFEN